MFSPTVCHGLTDLANVLRRIGTGDAYLLSEHLILKIDKRRFLRRILPGN